MKPSCSETKFKCKTFKTKEKEKSRSKSDKFPLENVRAAHSLLKRSKTRSSQIAVQRLGSLSRIQNIVFVDAESRTRNQFTALFSARRQHLAIPNLEQNCAIMPFEFAEKIGVSNESFEADFFVAVVTQRLKCVFVHDAKI